jgi:membrane-bound lytic murein transglycosylase D
MAMLADGAAANPTLADYYRSVKRRVAGQPESQPNPCIRVDSNNEAVLLNDFILPEHIVMLLSAEPAHATAADMPHLDADPNRPVQSGLTAGDMNFEMKPAVKRWTQYYASNPKGRKTMKVGLARCNPYVDMARAEFRKAGVPEDLVWLAFVESVWNPRAASPAAAGGLWQFIPPTAREYGLTVQSGNDERNDPAKQTRVAATYLHDLYAIFGDWELCMAAYNSGEPRVMGAIVRNGAADFWSLCDKQLLPKETRDYVPKILASIRVVAHPERYGFGSEGNAASDSAG